MLSYLLAILIIVGVYTLLTQCLNLHYGFMGLINFGVVGFFAIGAYTSALIAIAGYPILLGVLGAIVLASLSAWPLGVLATRLREDYLAIVTLGFAEVVRIVVTSESWLTNGVQGLPGIPQPFSSLGPNAQGLAFLGIVLACNLAVLALIMRLAHGPFGRLVEAIRDDEVAASALGKYPTGPRIQIFMIGAGIAGLAGALYGHYISYIVPDQFVPIVTFYVWMAMIMGGVGSLPGSFIGAAILIGLFEGTRFIDDAFPGSTGVEMASLRLVFIGLALVLFMRFRPQGIMGTRMQS